MIKYIYSFMDNKSGILTPPTVMQCDAEAERSILMLAQKNPDIPLIQFADDFTLFRIGEWDDLKGIISYKSFISCGNVESILARFRQKYLSRQNEAQNPQPTTENLSSDDNGSEAA